MATERWNRVDRLFHEAKTLNPESRTQFLRTMCGDDESMRKEIESLLRHHDTPLEFLDTPGFATRIQIDPSRLADDPEEDPLIGRTIGQYRIERRIAAGGMGTVYYAVRQDELLTQAVAIKVLHRYVLDSDELKRRFRIECQSQAHLNHINIARLQDAGVTDDGLSYMIMEYVEGVPIDAYCDAHHLNVDDRLNLFRTVCDAVHAAHQNLIVHRDLKPSNILVTRDGVPKLLDFGVAKILHHDEHQNAASPAVTSTSTMKQMLTVDYASPEQVLGQPVTTETDIYSLGVILFELLVGGRPYRLTSHRFDEIQQTVCVDPSKKPSTAVRSLTRRIDEVEGVDHWRTVAHNRNTSIERLERELRGDVDTIIMMAMRKEPNRRYASAQQFGEDIQRHLDGHPVLARQDTAVYRLSKFVMRNRVAVAAAALVILALLAATVVTTRQARIAELARLQSDHEANHARIEATSAAQVTDFLIDALLVSALDDASHERSRATQLLDRHVTRVRLQYADEPHLQANLIDAIGRVYMNLKLHDQAVALLDEAATVRANHFGKNSLEYALSLANLGEAAFTHGDFVTAVARYREALHLHESLPHGVHTDLALACNNLGSALQAIGNLDEAETHFQRALNLRLEAGVDASPQVAESLSQLALINLARHDCEQAIERLAEALRIRQSTLGENHPLVSETKLHLADAHLCAQEFELARPLLLDVIEHFEALPDTSGEALHRARQSLAEVDQQLDAAVQPRSLRTGFTAAPLDPHPQQALLQH